MTSLFSSGPSPYDDMPAFPDKKSSSKTPLILGIVIGIVGAAVIFALGYFTGNSSAPPAVGSVANGDDGRTSIIEVERDPDSPSKDTGSVAGGMGDAVDSEGVRLTVTDVTESESIDLMENWSEGERSATELLAAQTGGKLVSVTTTVENTGTEAWDLTCGFSIQAELVDEQGRHFQPIDDLYKIPGNPGCNEQTNPGFTKTMKWAFEVPQGAKGFKLGFADPIINYDKLTYVELD